MRWVVVRSGPSVAMARRAKCSPPLTTIWTRAQLSARSSEAHARRARQRSRRSDSSRVACSASCESGRAAGRDPRARRRRGTWLGARTSRWIDRANASPSGRPPLPSAHHGPQRRLHQHARHGNKMARERKSIEYDRAWPDGLVLGTSNKTELLLGYGTRHGDMACDLNPVGDLYKTQLRELSMHL